VGRGRGVSYCGRVRFWGDGKLLLCVEGLRSRCNPAWLLTCLLVGSDSMLAL
jgi:hypothetical protein